jgi:hypothetical protein
VDCERTLSDGSQNLIDDYLETIALLQEEVARLEQELHARDEGLPDTTSHDEPSLQDGAVAVTDLKDRAGEAAHIERLKAELAARDETINLLLEEVDRVEESQAATRAEWEHLTEWVAALEHRVEGQDGHAHHELESRLAGEEQKVDALKVKSEQDRRAWEVQRQIYQAEIVRLQRTVDEAATLRDSPVARDGRTTSDSSPDSNAVEALEAENLRLRAAWEDLDERTTASAMQSESMETRLAETLYERQQLSRQVEQIEDDRKREQLEHAATVAELQTRLAQASLTKPPEPPPQEKPDGISSELEIELRVRALRHHFQEVHEREKEERRQKQLISRLSRLWSRTGPR